MRYLHHRKLYLFVIEINIWIHWQAVSFCIYFNLFMNYSWITFMTSAFYVLIIIYNMSFAHFLAIQFFYHSWFWTQCFWFSHFDSSIIFINHLLLINYFISLFTADEIILFHHQRIILKILIYSWFIDFIIHCFLSKFMFVACWLTRIR